ncbi:MAG: ribbon-helix-helix protein, CopG family [Deferrisomatales bacterium]
MDKVLSARVDEAVLRRLGMLAEALGTTKKDVLERAIRTFSERLEQEQVLDVFLQTCGA